MSKRILTKGKGLTAAFKIVKAVGLAFPEVEAMTNWAGWPVLRVRGRFMAGLASHRSVEAGTLVVRCALDERERFLEDAPDTYYVTDYYQPYPVVLVRLSQLNSDALRDLLDGAWRATVEQARRPIPKRSQRSGPEVRVWP